MLVAGDLIEVFLDEVCRFPRGRFDDQVDAVSLAVAALACDGRGTIPETAPGYFKQKEIKVSKKDIELALGEFRRRAPLYEKAKRYYKVQHILVFASEKFANIFGSLFREFALNLCQAV